MKTAMLMGDSITGGLTDWGRRGYARLVQDGLASEWVIKTLPENGGDSRQLRSNLDHWLGDQHVDVIHFNCGLHDIRRSPGTMTMQVPLEEYAVNLHHIVSWLRRRGATLIWARTTPVLDGHRHPSKFFVRFNADVDAYNAVADDIMAAAGITINDLHGAVTAAGMEHCLSEDGVHMTPLGTHILSVKVIEALRAVPFTR